jgi:hypothetical protein
MAVSALASTWGGGLLLTGLLAGPVAADSVEKDMDGQKQTQTGSGQQASGEPGKPITKRLPDRYQLSSWMGMPVQNPAGDKLGTVKDLVMDDLGRVRYVIMKSQLLADNNQGGLVAVPVGHFVYPLAREDHLVFDATPTQVSQAPAFGPHATPNMGRPEISSVIVAYWVPEDSEQSAQQTGEPGYEGNRDIIRLSEPKSELFSALDQNDSGAIEPKEAKDHERLSEQFEEVDTYGNDAITRSEFAAFELKEAEASQYQDSDGNMTQ